ncbi:MAG: hypothetical protein IK122_03755 [Alphaproteobacteria bacterium]|nr:hypothetical protein [Alphaproteobacteria bacterium]
MNRIIKMLIKETIHNNRLVQTAVPVGEKYTIFDKIGHEILSVINGWATNNYYVSVNNKNVLSVRWDQSNSKPLTPEQKDMVDIINACKEKIDLQETAQTMNASELELANFLQQSLCNVKH